MQTSHSNHPIAKRHTTGDATKASRPRSSRSADNIASSGQVVAEEPKRLGTKLGINRQSFSMEEVNGDLFSVDESFSMAHCVAADLKMGKGIAIKFRNKFGRIHVLKQQNVKPGGVATLKHNSRFIYNLVTKQTSWSKPTYQALHSSLSAMRQHMLYNDVTKLAMPRIGCGLDGLSWPKVKDLIKEIFQNDLITIFIYNYAPPKI